jgi:NADH-quinone oxidoreductase subunit M
VILVWLIAIPLAGGFLAWAAGGASSALPRVISLVALGITLVLALALHATPAQPGWFAGFTMPWISTFGIDFRLRMDGVSWLLVVLTLALGMIAIITSWREVEENTGFFHANMLWSIAGTVGVFLADVFRDRDLGP